MLYHKESNLLDCIVFSLFTRQGPKEVLEHPSLLIWYIMWSSHCEQPFFENWQTSVPLVLELQHGLFRYILVYSNPPRESLGHSGFLDLKALLVRYGCFLVPGLEMVINREDVFVKSQWRVWPAQPGYNLQLAIKAWLISFHQRQPPQLSNTQYSTNTLPGSIVQYSS